MKAILLITFTCGSMLFSPALLAACKTDAFGVKQCGEGRCKIDSSGHVHCSMFTKGGAAVNSVGKVFCGKGRCLKDKSGEVFCATSVKDDIMINVLGKARCDKKCDVGKVEYCKTEPDLPPVIEIPAEDEQAQGRQILKR
ncbi:hypothetical protein [Algibacillus agarilyticus]|uniref:hypothetical protein n=1 Tax=Algibacillus agarilyticus TaxID=2234133 RepID=UPI00130047F0|nr:hypothetical protein [Algibacillus agarilyticus]